MSNLGDIYDFENILTEASDDLMPVSVASHFNRGDTGVDTYPRINVSLLSKTPNGHMQLNDDGNPFYDQFNCELEVSIKSDKAVTSYTTHTGYVNELRTAYGYNVNWNAVLPLTHRVAYVREEASDYSVDGTDNLNITTIRYSMLIVCSLSPFTPSTPTTDNDTIYQVTSSWAVNWDSSSLISFVEDLIQSRVYYLSATGSNVPGYYRLKETGSIATTVTLTTSSVSNGTYPFAWITEPNNPNATILPEGLYHVDFIARKTLPPNTVTLTPEIYIRNNSGVEYYELPSGQPTNALTTTFTRYNQVIILDSPVTMSSTDRLVVKLKAANTGTNDLELQVEGNVLSHFGTPLLNAIVTTTDSASYASYAATSNSASYALSSSYVTGIQNAFIQNGNSFGTASVLGTTDLHPLHFETNNTIRMTISASNGFVGINTPNPQHPLSVATSADAQGIQIRRMSSTTGASNEFGLRVASTEGINLAAIRSTRVDGNAGHNLQFITNPTGNNPTIRMTITSLGSVGIGTDAPSASLHVVGDISGSSIGVNSITMYGSSGSLFRLTINEETLGTGSLVITKI